jgi:hypothetical protein
MGQIMHATNCHITPAFSAKMVSSATASYNLPLRFKLTEFYSTANPTITTETITAGVTLTDAEFWIEIEYPDATDEAYGKVDITSKNVILTAATNLTTSTAAWTEDLAGEVKQKVTETISGGAAGIHTVWAYLAKPSTTVYVDPDVAVN